MFGPKWNKLWQSANDLKNWRQKPVQEERSFTWEEIGKLMVKGDNQPELVHINQDKLYGRPREVQEIPKSMIAPFALHAKPNSALRVLMFNTKQEYLRARQLWWTEMMDKQAVCERCRREKELTIDHIIPQQILQQMGFDIERMWDKQNLQILCRYCNTFKSNKLDFSNLKTKPLMLKYLTLIEDMPA